MYVMETGNVFNFGFYVLEYDIFFELYCFDMCMIVFYTNLVYITLVLRLCINVLSRWSTLLLENYNIININGFEDTHDIYVFFIF